MPTFIPINTGQRLGQQLRQAVDQARMTCDALAKLQSIMASQVDDPAAPKDFTVLEQQFGLQAGQGVLVYGLLSSVCTSLAASADRANLLTWCG